MGTDALLERAERGENTTQWHERDDSLGPVDKRSKPHTLVDTLEKLKEDGRPLFFLLSLAFVTHSFMELVSCVFSDELVRVHI